MADETPNSVDIIMSAQDYLALQQQRRTELATAQADIARLEADNAALRADAERLREALAAEDAFRAAYQNFRDAPLSNRKKEFDAYVEAAKRCDRIRAALTERKP